MLAPIVIVSAIDAAAGGAPVVGSCDERNGCVETGPAQLFALADKLFKRGELAAAAAILEALTQDKHFELRSEARFRLAALREKMGNLEGAAEALRNLLDEQPTASPARLELARILTRLGQFGAAKSKSLKLVHSACLQTLSKTSGDCRERFSLTSAAGCH